MTTDLELMALELETLWESDASGWLTVTRDTEKQPAPDLVVAVCSGGQLVRTGARLSGNLRAAAGAAIDSHPVATEPASRPPWLDDCRALLREASGRPVEVSSGPTYLASPMAPFDASSVIFRSSDGSVAAAVDANPPEANWPADEWTQLVGGALGPWAMAVEDGRVIAICHCARVTEGAAEAGVWTHPAHRGRGHAAAVTAAWAELSSAGGRTLFYSTAAENRSSQRVAERLRLREIGWLWKLERGGATR